MGQFDPTPDSPPPLRKTARRRAPDRGLHSLTFSCYRRQPLLGTDRLRAECAAALGRAKQRHRFKMLAWVVMYLGESPS